MNLAAFAQETFPNAIRQFFEAFNVPVDYLTEETARPEDILGETYRADHPAHALIREIYPVGVVNDVIFEGQETFTTADEVKQLSADYDGLLIFGVVLGTRENEQLPTRTQLADIARTINRAFHTMPVTVIFCYGDYLALANTERTAYQQSWREGEKVGKVSILRDIHLHQPHSAHRRILQRLTISRSGSKAVDNFKSLYQYWQTVLDVSVLNKAFYQELANWYFWAIRHVRFPGEPERMKGEKEAEFNDRLKSHRAQNVIRLVTRLMFSWFLKKKGLIPRELFDQQHLSAILNAGSQTESADSTFYRAILQNLFFATLNQEMDKREFRRPGQHYNTTNLYRYENAFVNPKAAIDLFRDIPFLNGGLFECLDKKNDQNVVERIDGFSDRNDVPLSVPDYLFFSEEREEDLSEEFGQKGKKYSQAKVKGLINLLNSYVFTVTENTPIEEDVALDPELLGKVFENLLASYNPETKTTARKQTGSFYTPREIVNYMVDESLIAYLKTELLKEEAGYLEFSRQQSDLFGNEARSGQLKLENKLDASPWVAKEEKLDEDLHQLFSYDPGQPLVDQITKEKIINALDRCTILDPACGSGAFPMGVLQKMVHVLQKLDPNNAQWKDRQLQRAYQLEDPDLQDKLVTDIEEAFANNELDYGRKLYLIENCIYGVDIQPIAVQIAKLRFFISLIVDQKPDPTKENLGIRPLPNLETKFVAANTLIGLDKPQQLLIRNPKIEGLEKELATVRHRHFSAKTPKTKRKWRERDKELREEIATLLINDGWNDQAARQVAEWDPYDQNYTAPFFDTEWMFGITDGLDVVIGNPPYRPIAKYDTRVKQLWAAQKYQVYANSGNIYFLFYEKAFTLLRKNGVTCLITSNQWLRNKSGQPLREYFLEHANPFLLIDFKGTDIFENVAVLSNILVATKTRFQNQLLACDFKSLNSTSGDMHRLVEDNAILLREVDAGSWLIFDKAKLKIRDEVIARGVKVSEWDIDINYGIKTGFNEAFYLTKAQKDQLIAEDPRNAEIIFPMLRGKDLRRYTPKFEDVWLIFTRRGIDIDEYPKIKNYLNHYYEELLPKKSSKEKKGRKPGNYQWYEIQDAVQYFEQFKRSKMIFMNMTKEVIFSFDREGKYFTNQKCFIVTGESTKYLTAFFNSKLFLYCFKDNFPELLGDVREVSKVYFEEIPVIEVDPKKQWLVERLVDLILYVKEHDDAKMSSAVVERIINGIICEFYFGEKMAEAGIDILKLVERDVSEAIGNQAFDQLPKAEQQAVATQLYQQWSNPDNEVPRRISLFAERSPDILKPILEG